jgi:16S rRNA (guanine1207-N2)-methyltransferase
LLSDYYKFRSISVLIQGEPATMVGKPGVWSWDDINPGTAALIDTMEVQPNNRVLDLGCGTGVIGLASARSAPAGRVTLVDVNTAAVECARQTLAKNRVRNAEVRLADGIDECDAYDVVVSHLPRGREVVESLIYDVASALYPGGRFYFVAHKRAGIKHAIAHAAHLLGRAGVVRQRRGYHVAFAMKEQPQAPQAAERKAAFRTVNVTLEGIPTTLVSCPGVFAWDRVDDGTAALINAMEVEPEQKVLDLGCGTGLLALAASRRGGAVTAVDADLRAVESARRTLAANQVQAETLISDCAQAVSERRFDMVLCNPPFHQGVGVQYDVARQMLRDAATVLRSRGKLFLVSNAFLRYEREMPGEFVATKEVFNDRRYRVLRALRGEARSSRFP